MFRLLSQTPIDLEVAHDIVVATDEIFGNPELVSISQALALVLGERPVEPVLTTLLVGAARLIEKFQSKDPDSARGETTDEVAAFLFTKVWRRPDQTEVAQAILRMVIDDGMAGDLSDDLFETFAEMGAAQRLVTLAQTVMAMSWLCSNLDDKPAGDALREVWDICS
jgi:hypothetical protein